MVCRASDFEMRGSCKARLLADGGGGQALACHLSEVVVREWLIDTLSSLE